MTASLVIIVPDDRTPEGVGSGKVPSRGQDSGQDSDSASSPSSSESEEHFEILYLPEQKWFGGNKAREAIAIKIPAEQPSLSATLRRELLAAYIIHGWIGVRQFSAGVFGLAAYGDFVDAGGLKEKSFFGPLTGEAANEEMGKAVAEDRRPLWNAYDVERRLLRERVVALEKRLEKAAGEIASARVERCRALLLAEAQRYLSLAEPKAASAAAVLAGSDADARAQAVTGLRGPEAAALLASLRELRPRFRSLEQDRRDFLTSRGLQGAAIATAILPGLQPLAPLARMAAPEPDTAAAQARALAISSDDFARAFTRAAAGYPILFRLVEADPERERDIALAVAEILQDAWKACAALESDLASPDVVWTMPRLIERTVAERFGAEAALAERVAADMLKRVGVKIHPMEAMNYVVSGLDSALMLVPFPPLQLGMLVLSTLAGVAETAETWVRDAAKRHTARAALDPSLALASEPSILGIIAQAALVALCVLPVPGLVKEIREMKKAASLAP